MLYLSAWTKSFVCSEKKTSKSDTYKNKGLFFAQNHDHMGWLHVIFTPEFRLKGTAVMKFKDFCSLEGNP